jgi:O-antigen/teichoic acid export membrane protein
MSQSLTARTLNGVKWTSIATLSNSFMQIGYTAVMARLLDPAAFGLVAMSGVILRFGGYFANMGMAQAIIQKKELSNEDIRAAFTSALLLGTVFFVIIWYLAPFAVLIFDNTEVIEVVRIMALSFLIGGFSSTANSLLRRRMEFKILSVTETCSYIIAYLGIGIILAYAGFGVWSLVIATLSQTFIVSIISYLFVRHNIQLLFSWRHYKPLFAYGSKMSFISFLEFLYSNMDTLLIGHFLGSSKLGIYNRAYNLIYLPLYFLTTSLAKVIFPSFSQIQFDRQKLANIYLSSITLVATILIPASIGVVVASQELVLILLGSKWTESIPILQIICIAIPLSLITMFAGIVCDATASLKKKIILNLIYILFIIFLFFVLKDFGLKGFAATIAIGEAVKTLMYIYLMKQILGVDYKRLFSCYLPGLINGSVIGVILYLITASLRSTDSPVWVIFGCQLITGTIVLCVLMLLVPHPVLKTEIYTFISRLDLSRSRYYHNIVLPYINFLNKKA